MKIRLKNKLGSLGFTLVEIMIVVAIIALIAAIAIPNLLRARQTANEASAQATLKTIAAAFEMYAAVNEGMYPTDESALINPAAGPPYLSRSYNGMVVQGYTYAYITLDSSSYAVRAWPVPLRDEGGCYRIETGARLREAPCPEVSP